MSGKAEEGKIFFVKPFANYVQCEEVLVLLVASQVASFGSLCSKCLDLTVTALM